MGLILNLASGDSFTFGSTVATVDGITTPTSCTLRIGATVYPVGASGWASLGGGCKVRMALPRRDYVVGGKPPSKVRIQFDAPNIAITRKDYINKGVGYGK
jgi:hypothetical protein